MYIYMPIHNEIPCNKSQNDFCCFSCVTWLLTLCFKMLGLKPRMWLTWWSQMFTNYSVQLL